MKRIFFAAALAIVAIGGALTASADNTFYSAGGAQSFNCNSGTASCSAAIGSTTVFSIDAPEGQQGDPVSPSVYADLLFTPN